jgi:hypothetical protein
MTVSPRSARLHLLTLSSFAVAQPLYDLIGRNAQFLVAHGADARTIAALIGLLSLGVPLVCIAVVDLVRMLNRGAGAAAHLVAVALLGALIAASPLRVWPSAVAIPLALTAGAALAAGYTRSPIRLFVTLLCPAVVVFPVLFVTMTPVSRLLKSGFDGPDAAAVRTKPPIVLVIFDELSTFDILDAAGQIDTQRFPALGSLAATSSWFPNAVSPFPYTERAIPAILTGRAPAADARLPIVADHPDNLFTWLAGSYAIHASEPVTALCPKEVCAAQTSTTAKSTAAEFVSDVAILYLHLVTPRDIAERRLPSLAGTWQRFKTAGGTDARADARPAVQPEARPAAFDVVAAFETASLPGRDTLFRRFVERVDRGTQPALYFIHALLPHDPYLFTPAGYRYSVGGLTEGMSTTGVWTPQQPLIDTGRERHVAQARLSDKLLGELLARLRATDLFDAALIVVTSDHGAAFKPGESHRGMTESNATEILAVPMFVKVPNQRAAEVSDRPVSGLDIVATIAGVLQTPLPWTQDGHAMLAAQYPARQSIEYASASVGPLPLLDVRSEARTGLYGAASLARTSPAPELRGTVIPDLDALPAAPEMRVFSEDFARLEAVTRDGLFPALVSGEIQFDRSHDGPVTLAFALNGTIAAVTRTVEWAGSKHYFSVLLPDDLIRAGSNRLDVLQVRGTASGARDLARISDDFARGLTLTMVTEGQAIVGKSGAPMLAGPQVTGFVDTAVEEPNALKLFGWAADVKSPNPLRSIVAFSGGRAVAFASPHAERPDVTAALGLTAGQKVSYALTIPKRALAGPVRVFGISATRQAGELRVPPANADIMRRAVKSAGG